jgi:hypothetical protein
MKSVLTPSRPQCGSADAQELFGSLSHLICVKIRTLSALILLCFLAKKSEIRGLAETVEIPCSADATIHEVFPQANFGAATQVNTGSTEHGVPGSPARTRGLYAFDLQGKIPPGATIDRVRVKMSVIFSPATPPVVVDYGLHRMFAHWGEGGGSGSSGRAALDGESSWQWRSKPDAWGTAGGQAGVDFQAAPSASVSMGAPGDYVLESNALKEELRQWLLDPAQNFGWILICGSEDIAQTAKRFGSREGGSPAVLTIDFSVPASDLNLSISRTSRGIHLAWSGGTPPYELQFKTNLSDAAWTPAAPASTNLTADLPALLEAQIFRVAVGISQP